MRGEVSKGLAAIDALHTTFARIAQSDRPVVFGPWITEVGYELLYWLPFLRWAQRTYGIDPARCVAVSRGGCASWYADLAGRYLDLFTWFEPRVFRQANIARLLLTRTQKQDSLSNFDRQVLRRVATVIGDEYDLVHPSMLYLTYLAERPWSAGSQARAIHAPIPPVTPWPGLPDRYAAVRFYTSQICPDTLAVKALMTSVVRRVAREMPVVLLTTRKRLDDHDELRVPPSAMIHRLDAVMTPARNLEIQTRVIAGATKFLGTYGGFAYLAPMLGVDAESYYAQERALHKLRRHVPIAHSVFGSDPQYGRLRIATLNEPHVEYAWAS